jgi:ABC-type transport system involved in multi-copper enzyme maturation permease subunit
MTALPPAIVIVARNELADGLRSRRALVLLVLYLAGAMAGTALFIHALQSVETELVNTLGLTPSKAPGGVTATLWKSDAFKRILTGLVGDRELAESLLGIPPLALFYGWLAMTFTPLLVILMSSMRIAEEVWGGAVRYVLFRAPRLHWVIGKFAGQALQIVAALLLSALGAWLVGWFRMNAFEPGPTAVAMLGFACKAWIYALAFLGLATAVSQVCGAPNLAAATGLIALTVLSVVGALARHYAGAGWRRLWDVVAVLTPGGHHGDLAWGDLAHAGPAAVYLLALAAGLVLLGYARFARRDL